MGTDAARSPAADERHAISRFAEKLRGTYDVSRIIMFGSRARADGRPDSDLDLAIVLAGERGDVLRLKLEMAGLAFDVMLGDRRPVAGPADLGRRP